MSAKAAVQVETKERPIIFGAESVRAILEGRKTQTRRVFKFPAHMAKEGSAWVKAIHEDGGGNWIPWSTDAPGYAEFTKQAYPKGEGIVCPYGKPGDRLWVRESFVMWPLAGRDGAAGEIYRATNPMYDDAPSRIGRKWVSPILMPRWASRITLELTDVRVERLTEISPSDACAEGLTKFCHRFARDMDICHAAFAEGWDKLNKARGFGWDSNPWVWVLSFRRLPNDAGA